MTDTTQAVARLVRSKIMARSGAERLVMGARMFEAAREMVLASFPPNISQPERRRRLYERIYGEPLPVGRQESLELHHPVVAKHIVLHSPDGEGPGGGTGAVPSH